MEKKNKEDVLKLEQIKSIKNNSKLSIYQYLPKIYDLGHISGVFVLKLIHFINLNDKSDKVENSQYVRAKLETLQILSLKNFNQHSEKFVKTTSR